jgi:hypothetical protein
MQIKTILRAHLTPVIMPTFKKTTKNEQGGGGWIRKWNKNGKLD